MQETQQEESKTKTPSTFSDLDYIPLRFLSREIKCCEKLARDGG